MSERSLRRAHAALFVLYALALAASAQRPVDTPDWREADLAGVARNFERESMDPLRPRIDWRGDGDGVVEMEPPLLPYAMALLAPLSGEDVRAGRLLSLAAWLGAFAFFLALARERTTPAGALVAGAAFALNPLGAQVATELRSEPLMLCGLIAAVYYAERWLRTSPTLRSAAPRCALRLRLRGDRARAALATAFAIFTKLPAIHLGLLLAALALRRRGARALRDPELWGFAALVLLPAALWYGYARTLWLATGNSLGLSNQDHLFGLDLLANPRPFAGVWSTERNLVWGPAGVALVLLGGLAGAWRRWLELELWWLAALTLFYVETAATTGEAWASYYHVASLPLAALLIGSAAATLLSAGFASAARAHAARVAGALLLAATLAQAAVASAALVARRLPGRAVPDPFARCAGAFAPQIPMEARLLVAGGRCRDPYGRRVAHNRPYFFYWLDRKGYQPCAEDQSLESVAAFAARGADFFVAERRDLLAPDGFEAALRARYALAAECPVALLFDLRSPAPGWRR